MQIIGHILYLTVLTLLALAIPQGALDHGPILALGLIGLWRYSWAGTNFARAVWYQHIAHPAEKRRVMAQHQLRMIAPHAFFLVTSFKIEPDVTTRVYQSIFAAAAKAEGGASVVASVVDGADARLIRTVFAQMRVDMVGVSLVVDQIAGTGKRDALMC